MKPTDKTSKKKKYVSMLITIICVGVFVFAASNLLGIFMDYYENRKLMASLQETFYDVVSAKEKEALKEKFSSRKSEIPTIRSEFQELYKENEDLVGWISIEGTEVDYPIVQSDDNQFYLNHNFYKEYSIAGSIFMDFRNDIVTLQPNTIVYGHRMRDGSMFDDLINYKDEDYFKKQHTIEFTTLYETYEAEIFAAYITTTDFNYIKTDFATEEEYEQFLTRIQEESIYQTGVEVTTDDQIITLSTCDYVLDPNEGRMVVHAKLVKK